MNEEKDKFEIKTKTKFNVQPDISKQHRKIAKLVKIKKE